MDALLSWGYSRPVSFHSTSNCCAFGKRQDFDLVGRVCGALSSACSQVLQRGVHVVADALRLDARDDLRGQREAFAQVVDRQGERIVGALLVRLATASLPRPALLPSLVAWRAVAVVQAAR